ncbi:BC1872 family protein [Paenibacillus rigui]|nr:hypothetical protein [Paenibacillus rigui]
MDSGPELDKLVAEKVMGWTSIAKLRWKDPKGVTNFVPDYSTDISAAWEVVEKMSRGKTDCSFVLQFHFERYYAKFGEVPIDNKRWNSYLTAPEAICKAALLSTLEV